MTTTATVATKPAAPIARAVPATASAAPRVRAVALASDAYRPSTREKANLAQPIGMGMFVVGGLGSMLARGNAFFALMGLAAAGLAVAGTGVKITMPDGSTKIAGLRGATVIAPGAGFLVGGAAALAMGLSGWAFVAVAMVPFAIGMLASQTLLK